LRSSPELRAEYATRLIEVLEPLGPVVNAVIGGPAGVKLERRLQLAVVALKRARGRATPKPVSRRPRRSQ
jgi:hypothetical protein